MGCVPCLRELGAKAAASRASRWGSVRMAHLPLALACRSRCFAVAPLAIVVLQTPIASFRMPVHNGLQLVYRSVHPGNVWGGLRRPGCLTGRKDLQRCSWVALDFRLRRQRAI